MSRKKAKAPEPPPDPRPRRFETYGQGLLEYVARDQAGEFIIESISVGKSPAQWIIRVFYRTPYSEQTELAL